MAEILTTENRKAPPMNVLVVPCGTEIGLEISRSLKGVKNITLTGANSVRDFSSLVYEDFECPVPFVDDPGFLPAVKEIIARRGITHVFPAHDSATLLLSRYAADLGPQVKVLTSPYRTNQVLRSKKLTYQTLAGAVAVPRVFQAGEPGPGDFPLFAKPDVGQGSRGARRVDSPEDLGQIDFATSVVTEYLAGREYTVDCFSDADGKLRHVSPRRRDLITNGIAVGTELVREDKGAFESFASAINASLEFQGAWFFQVKERSPGELVLLEAASRIAGSMAASRVQGVNFAELTLHIFNGTAVELLANDFGVRLKRSLGNRYELTIDFQNVYLDFDDCLVIDGKVNDQLVAFLFQCLNRNKRLCLISRHRGDLFAALERYRLLALFDEVLKIYDDTSPKSRHIKAEHSILIDDSYAERREVSRALGIPVFSVDAVEALLEGRV